MFQINIFTELKNQGLFTDARRFHSLENTPPMGEEVGVHFTHWSSRLNQSETESSSGWVGLTNGRQEGFTYEGQSG